MISSVAEVKELKANPHRRAKGAVIEARLDRGRAPWPRSSSRRGTLHQGDVVIAGTSVGRVRVMRDDAGRHPQGGRSLHAGGDHGPDGGACGGDLFDAVERREAGP